MGTFAMLPNLSVNPESDTSLFIYFKMYAFFPTTGESALLSNSVCWDGSDSNSELIFCCGCDWIVYTAGIENTTGSKKIL